MSNMFEKAKGDTAPAPKKKGKVKPQLQVDELHTLAALLAAQKTIKTMVDTLQADVNSEALSSFLVRQKKDSIEGVDGDTTASLQLRKRTSKSALSEQELAILEEKGIDVEKSADSKFYINSSYADDADLLARVSDALEGIVPEDFFGHTGDKYIVGDNAVTQALELDDEADRRAVVNIVATQAARTKFGGDDEEMLKILSEVLKG